MAINVVPGITGAIFILVIAVAVVAVLRMRDVQWPMAALGGVIAAAVAYFVWVLLVFAVLDAAM